MSGLLANWRLAWRDLAAQGRRAAFFALLVAVGVASLVGVQGVAGSMERATNDSARQMMQGDLMIANPPGVQPEEMQAVLENLRERYETTEVYSGMNMAVLGQDSAMVEIKAVDPTKWPLYGGLELSPDRPLDQLITSDREIIVQPALLVRLGAAVGDEIEIGRSTFLVTGTLEYEPQILGGNIALGPRVIMTQAAYREAISDPNQTVTYVKVDESVDLLALKAEVAGSLDGAVQVMTYEEAWSVMQSAMDHLFTFLGMIAFISLLVGGLGVAMAMRTFIRQKLELIAVLKSIGAGSRRVAAVFLMQAAVLGLAGSVAGAVAGLAVQWYLPSLLAEILPTMPTDLNFGVMWGGLVGGTATALICALLPVRAVRQVKPIALFRSESGDAKAGWGARMEGLLVGLVVLVGLGWLAVRYAKSVNVGLGFLGGLLGVSLVLAFIGWLVLKLTRLLPQRGHPVIRHATRSLHAPGNQPTSIVVAMGLGITIMTGIWVLQNMVLSQMSNAGNTSDTPNLIVMGAGPDETGDLRQYLSQHPGIKKVPQGISFAQASLLAVDGATVSESHRAQASMLTTTEVTEPAPDMVAGSWFEPADAGQPVIILNERMAEVLKVGVGSTMTFSAAGEEKEFTVKGIAKNTAVQVGSGLSVPSGSVPVTTAIPIVMAQTHPGQEAAVVRDLLREYPGVMPLSLSDLLNVVERMLASVAGILRFLTGFAVAAAAVILSGSLSATQLRRRKEAALLKTLGATRAEVATASALENGLLGAAAGLTGSGLACLGLKAVSGLLDLPALPVAGPMLMATVGGALLAVLVGLASTIDVLQIRPLSVLRSE